MRNDEIKALKVDIPFYVQKIADVMQAQFPMMPSITRYDVCVDQKYGIYARLWDKYDGVFHVDYSGVRYQPPEDKLSVMAATMADGMSTENS